MQIANYRKLTDAVAFLQGNSMIIKYLPSDLFPGINYSTLAFDPQGHAIQPYCHMEQIGWDGRPRPVAPRCKPDNNNWPATADVLSDTYRGPVFQGPLG